MNEIKFSTELKKHLVTQIDKIKDTEVKASDSKDLIKKIQEDIKEKTDKIKIYKEKVINDLKNINTEKNNFEKEIKEKVRKFFEFRENHTK